jgi:hypothetical protein
MTWMPNVGDEFEIAAIANQIVIGDGQPPLKRVVSHFGIGMKRNVELAGGWSEVSSDEKGNFNFDFDSINEEWLNSEHLHRPGEVNAIVISAAGAQDLEFSNYIDTLRKHCWFWLQEKPLIPSVEVNNFLVGRMQAAFSDWLNQTEDDLSRMRTSIHCSESSPDLFTVDTSITRNFTDEPEFFNAFMLESRKRNEQKTVQLIKEVISNLLPDELDEQNEYLMSRFGTTDIDSALRQANDMLDAGLTTYREIPNNTSKNKIQVARKRICKAYKLFDNLGFESIVSDFAAGNPVEIPCKSGLKFVACLRKGQYNGIVAKSTFLHHFAVSFDIKVKSPGGDHLGNLCAYLQNTPILDMLMAIILHAQSGSEDKLMEKSNWYAIPDLELTKSTIFGIYGRLFGNLESMIQRVQLEEQFCKGTYAPEPFNLNYWLGMPDIASMSDEWVWSDAHPLPVQSVDYGDTSWLAPRKALSEPQTFSAALANGHAALVDKAISTWLGRAIKRWAGVRPIMERLYVENRFPNTPVGWCEGHATAFVGYSC